LGNHSFTCFGFSGLSRRNLQTLPVSPDAVLLRIKQLEREEVIVRYRLVLDNSKLNQLNYYVLVT